MDKKKLYIIERWGVYQRGTAGVFSSRDDAEVVARMLINSEPDDYHTYTVSCFEDGETIVLIKYDEYGKTTPSCEGDIIISRTGEDIDIKRMINGMWTK